MSKPLHNTIDNINGNISPWLCQRLRKQSADKELEKGFEGSNNFSADTSEGTGSFLESKNVRNPYARRYFRKRQRFSAKDQSPSVLKDEDDGDEDCSDIEQLIIKEEYIETTVCDDSTEPPCMSTGDSFDVFPTPGVEHKPCPYCPAMFESGVGLSNHVRGHLHRVGLSYNARHMVSPEQVALQDHQPRIRRRIPCGTRRKTVNPETHGEHTCPLCWGWFDTKTGLSNHVRGHLKRIGKGVTSTSKSPLCILNELLQDKKERQNILQVLNKSQFPSPSFVSQKFSSNGLILMHMGIPVKIQHEMRRPHPLLDSFLPKQEAEAFSERKKLQEEAQRGTKACSSTLVELLKMRQESMDLTARNNQEACAARKSCDLTKDYMEETQMTSYDYKQKKPRPRPGLKKKIVSSLNAEIYTLTCRFCDLVFQGPLSIQEDWIKHLQRHLLHTSVPHSGTGMVEVLGLHHKIQMSMSPEHPDLE
uniref:C2H2-type domain-containing protein n=1 Tax=Sander lucioperca TaxID=283035 RepID=A0A8C9ZLN6_SANLU